MKDLSMKRLLLSILTLVGCGIPAQPQPQLTATTSEDLQLFQEASPGRRLKAEFAEGPHGYRHFWQFQL
jgi:hypothetical protein